VILKYQHVEVGGEIDPCHILRLLLPEKAQEEGHNIPYRLLMFRRMVNCLYLKPFRVLQKDFRVHIKLSLRFQHQIHSKLNGTSSFLSRSRMEAEFCDATVTGMNNFPITDTQAITEICFTFQDVP
jgi:hypothetical protein